MIDDLMWDGQPASGARKQSMQDAPLVPPGAVANKMVNIVATHSGKCFDVRNADMEDNTLIQQFSCGGSAEQRFVIR